MLPDIGFKEIIVITVVAIIVINPKDWPKVLRQVGRIYGKLHDFLLQMRHYTRDTMDQIKKLDVEEHSSDESAAEKLRNVKPKSSADSDNEGLDAELAEMEDHDNLGYAYHDDDHDEDEDSMREPEDNVKNKSAEQTNGDDRGKDSEKAKSPTEIASGEDAMAVQG